MIVPVPTEPFQNVVVEPFRSSAPLNCTVSPSLKVCGSAVENVTGVIVVTTGQADVPACGIALPSGQGFPATGVTAGADESPPPPPPPHADSRNTTARAANKRT